MSLAGAAAHAGAVPGFQARDWLISGALHGALALALWQLATANSAAPLAVQRLELPIRWAAEPVAAVAPSPPAIAHAVPPRSPEPRVRAAASPRASAPRLEQQVPVAPIAPAVPAPTQASRLAPEPDAPPAGHSPAVVAPVEAAPTQTVVATRPGATAAASGDASAATAARPAAADPPTQRQWRGHLEQLLLEHKRYPLQARRMRQQGVVLVEASFSADGDLLRCDVADSSGFRSLDEAALQLVRTAAGLLRSRQAPGRLAELRIPIAYELSGS